MTSKRILIPLPSYGFDPTESGVPWAILKAAGHGISFSTPDGNPAEADRRMMTGEELPLLFRATLRAEPTAIERYREMAGSDAFRKPLLYEEARAEDFDALLLPGGHDKGMRPYLESKILQTLISRFFAEDRPVGAICHGTLLVARSKSASGRSVLWGRRTTGLTRRQEMTAFALTVLKLGDYYRTYPVAMMDEVISLLRHASDFDPGPGWPIPTRRDTAVDLSPGFVLRDRNYLSARWPGDAHRFGKEFLAML